MFITILAQKIIYIFTFYPKKLKTKILFSKKNQKKEIFYLFYYKKLSLM